ncbi:phosphoenolpyruvate synthase [candidate division KSB1 bacterium]|nr:phosphoenolpyruvate synthase [candidate division KSB1 bacterium]
MERDITEAFRPTDMASLQRYTSKLPPQSKVVQKVSVILKNQPLTISFETAAPFVDILWECRHELETFPTPAQRLAALDLSVVLESILFRDINNWQPHSLADLLTKSYFLIKAVAACGFLEIWEFNEIDFYLRVEPLFSSISLAEMQQKVDYAKRALEWSSAMVRAVYQEPLEKFAAFEPHIQSYIDDRIRNSLLLPLGATVGAVADFYAGQAGLKQHLLNITSQNQVYGLNPGYTMGELVIVPTLDALTTFSPDKIYVLATPPVDLKPVAGLLVVSEGNLVSHVQLLARNLGIPNAVISQQNFDDLKPFNGTKVFYAVSTQGTVRMKTVDMMNREEQSLFSTTARREEKIAIPTNNLQLNQTNILNLRDVRAKDSGKISGPKAANLGELKSLFPEHVVEGLVLPFGIFYRHMEQFMPGTNTSYWQFLQETFQVARQQQKNGIAESQVEKYILSRLETIRNNIKKMPLLPAFEKELYDKFQIILGTSLGDTPVFIRSDTNMEDLKDFTGAGLNLTVFNVRDPVKIMQGIRDVWASPFSERSYQWRQRLMLNPENVYPSILIIPSVDVDKSGVMITTGVFSGETHDITIAFNRGAGGAVEGQVAESYTLQSAARQHLLSPSREKRYTTLPADGGTKKCYTTFETPILNRSEIGQLRLLAQSIRARLPGVTGIESQGPFDIELGFKAGKIWLFQIRPFVENKRARSSSYLNSIDPVIDKKRMVALSAPYSQP